METYVNLDDRIKFFETGIPLNILNEEDGGRVGTYESYTIFLIIKINLTGCISNILDGRLYCSSNSRVRVYFYNHDYSGIISLYSLNIENNNYLFTSDFEISGSVGYIDIYLRDLYEKEGVLYGLLIAEDNFYHHFVHFHNSNSILISEIENSISNLLIINEEIGVDGIAIINRYIKDYIKIDISVTNKSKNIFNVLFQSYEYMDDTSNGNYTEAYHDQNPNLKYGFSYPCQSLQLNGKIYYAGVVYNHTLTIRKRSLIPLLIKYKNFNINTCNVLKLYYPDYISKNNDNNAFAPIIFYIHGGDWRSYLTLLGPNLFPDNANIAQRIEVNRFGQNNAIVDGDYIENFLKIGYIVCVVEYNGIQQYLSDYNCQTILQDINDALSFLYNNRVSLHIDSSKMVFWGYSAGGHIALLYSNICSIENNVYNLQTSFDIQYVFSEAGPTYLTYICDYYSNSTPQIDSYQDLANVAFLNNVSITFYDENTYYSIFQNHIITTLGLLCNSNPANISDWNEKSMLFSPMNYVNAHSPKTVLIYSDCDDVVYKYQSDFMEQSLFAENIPYITINPLCNHQGYTYSLDNINDSITAILEGVMNDE